MRDYSEYFSGDKSSAYKWDVGPMSLRKIVADECRGKILEIGPGLNRVFPDSETMDVQGDPDYLRSIADPCDDLVERFDTIVMVHVFEHVVQDEAAIANCYRMLRPGGALVVVSPGHKSGICTHKETEENGHIRTMNLEYVRSMQLPAFRLRKYRSVHTAHNVVWNRLKFALKAACFPMKLVDKKEMYDRRPYRWLAPRIASALDAFDKRVTRSRNGNILFVLEKHGKREIMAGAAAGSATNACTGVEHAPEARASVRSRRALPLLPVLLLVLVIVGYAARDAGAKTAPAARSTAVADDSGGKKPDSSNVDGEKGATVGQMPLRRADSTWKHLNIYTMYIGDTSGHDVNREVVMALKENDHYRGRDSSFVFQGDACIRIELRLGLTADVPDTVLWINLCAPCVRSDTIPIGCYEWREETLETIQLYTRCDTTYYSTDTLRTYFEYWQIEQSQWYLLTRGYACAKPQSSSSQIKVVKKGYRYYGLVNSTIPFAYPIDDSCWISPLSFATYELVYGPYGAGLWYVDSSSTSYGQRILDWTYWGLPGVFRDTSNCRTETRTNTIVQRYQEWVYAGRDTIILSNNCDPCLIPYLICEGGALDSLRRVEYIYDYVTEPDTIKEPCTKPYYRIPIGGEAFWAPPEVDRCTNGDSISNAFLVWLNANWLTKGTTSWSPGRIAVFYSGDFACRTCDGTVEPPAYTYTRYFLPTDIDPEFPCRNDTCAILDLQYRDTVGNCCEKDTILTLYCSEGDTHLDSTVITYSIPDITQPCLDSTIIGIVPGDTIWVIVDSVVTWIHFYTPRTYRLAWEDTCSCIPMLNDRSICDPGVWIIRDCDPPIYWGDDGRLHIPCNNEMETSLTELYEALAGHKKEMRDSIRILRGQLTLLQIKVDSCCALTGATDHNSLAGLQGGDGVNYYHLTADEMSNVGEIPTMQSKLTVHETAIDGIRDSLLLIFADSIAGLRHDIDSMQTVIDGISGGSTDTTHFIRNLESGIAHATQQVIPTKIEVRAAVLFKAVTAGSIATDSLLVIDATGQIKKVAPTAFEKAWTVTSKTAAYTAADHEIILANVGGGDFSITLPETVSPGWQCIVKRTDASEGNTLTIAGRVDETDNPTLSALKAYRIVSDGTSYFFIGQY